MHILKSVGVMSVAKIMGLIYGCMGLIFVPFFLLIGVVGAFAQKGSPFAGIFGLFLAVMMPFMYGIMGFIVGAIGAWLYNVCAKWVGGFEFEVEARSSGPIAPYPVIPPPTPSI